MQMGVSIALKNNVWVVDSIRPEHTHELLQDHAEILSANRSVRSGIPEELKITGEMTRLGGTAAKTIDKTLTINAKLIAKFHVSYSCKISCLIFTN